MVCAVYCTNYGTCMCSYAFIELFKFFSYFCPYLLDFVYASVSKSDRIVDNIPACLSLI